jgi:hypothetical protein
VLAPSEPRLPEIVFVANMVFAMVISGAVGLWQPIVIAILVAGSPFALAQIRRRPAGAGARLKYGHDR